MADQTLKGEERARFPGLLGLGLLMAVAIIAVAWVLLGTEFAVPILILTVICFAAAVGYRSLAGSNRGQSGDADSGDNVPKQPARGDRPLGDTPEAHDEINVHDMPLDSPGRHAAEAMAGDEDATTRGMSAGGGAGGTARFSSDADTGDAEVSADEAHGGAEAGR
jgi:hypothetical protein